MHCIVYIPWSHYLFKICVDALHCIYIVNTVLVTGVCWCITLYIQRGHSIYYSCVLIHCTVYTTGTPYLLQVCVDILHCIYNGKTVLVTAVCWCIALYIQREHSTCYSCVLMHCIVYTASTQYLLQLCVDTLHCIYNGNTVLVTAVCWYIALYIQREHGTCYSCVLIHCTVYTTGKQYLLQLCVDALHCIYSIDTVLVTAVCWYIALYIQREHSTCYKCVLMH
jgi:hypothetical protein